MTFEIMGTTHKGKCIIRKFTVPCHVELPEILKIDQTELKDLPFITVDELLNQPKSWIEKIERVKPKLFAFYKKLNERLKNLTETILGIRIVSHPKNKKFLRNIGIRLVEKIMSPFIKKEFVSKNRGKIGTVKKHRSYSTTAGIKRA